MVGSCGRFFRAVLQGGSSGRFCRLFPGPFRNRGRTETRRGPLCRIGRVVGMGERERGRFRASDEVTAARLRRRRRRARRGAECAGCPEGRNQRKGKISPYIWTTVHKFERENPKKQWVKKMANVDRTVFPACFFVGRACGAGTAATANGSGEACPPMPACRRAHRPPVHRRRTIDVHIMF